jgi:hypothetical protein
MDTQALDDSADDGSVVAHRARARDLLPEISRQAKAGLSQRGINHWLERDADQSRVPPPKT